MGPIFIIFGNVKLSKFGQFSFDSDKTIYNSILNETISTEIKTNYGLLKHDLVIVVIVAFLETGLLLSKKKMSETVKAVVVNMLQNIRIIFGYFFDILLFHRYPNVYSILGSGIILV